MSDITTLTIPHKLIEEAKRLNINCSETARNAIQAEINVRKMKTKAISG